MLVTQLCPTLWDPMDCSLPVYRHQRTSSSVHGILHARILEWVAISFSRASSWPRDRTRVSCSAVGFFTVEPLGSKNNMGPANIWRGVRKISWRRKWQPTPVLWPGESPRTEEPGVLQSRGVAGSWTLLSGKAAAATFKGRLETVSVWLPIPQFCLYDSECLSFPLF